MARGSMAMKNIREREEDEELGIRENPGPIVAPVRGKTSEEEEAEALERVTPGLPLPMAPVVRMIKSQIGDKMVSSKVKVAMNKFLGEVAGAVAKEMGQTRYPMIEMDDFLRATKPYTYAKEMQAEKERVVKELDAMRAKIESMIQEFQRKFAVPKADEFSVLPREQNKR